jgi:hypothetical protein
VPFNPCEHTVPGRVERVARLASGARRGRQGLGIGGGSNSLCGAYSTTVTIALGLVRISSPQGWQCPTRTPASPPGREARAGVIPG